MMALVNLPALFFVATPFFFTGYAVLPIVVGPMADEARGGAEGLPLDARRGSRVL